MPQRAQNKEARQNTNVSHPNLSEPIQTNSNQSKPIWTYPNQSELFQTYPERNFWLMCKSSN